MKFSVGVNVLAGLVFLMGVGCGPSDSSSSPERAGKENEEDVSVREPTVIDPVSPPQDKELQEYIKVIGQQMTELQNSHADLVKAAQHVGSDPEHQRLWETSLDDLTLKSNEVERKIQALKAAKEQEWITLQPGLTHALQELSESYERALARVAG